MTHHRHVAALVVVVASALSIAAMPTTTVRAQRPCTTAIALRDRVPDEQMLGTKLFTVPLLLGGYHGYRYLEATDDDDGRARLIAALAEARAENDGEGCSVDLFLLAHGDFLFNRNFKYSAYRRTMKLTLLRDAVDLLPEAATRGLVQRYRRVSKMSR